MAKKDKSDQPCIDDFLRKKYGEIIISPQDILDKPRQTIPLSPSLNFALNGGIPEGSWVLISGVPKCTKSTLSLHFSVKAQQKEFGEKEIYYFNIEGRLKPMNLECIPNLDLDRFHIISSTEEKILTGEDYLSVAAHLFRTKKNCVFIIDSLSAICPSDRVDEEISGSKRTSGPKMVSDFTKQMAGVVPINNHIVICIQHLIANTSGYGPSKMEDGGIKIQYQADVRLRQYSLQLWQGKEEQIIGQIVGWEVLCSALGPPGAKVNSYHRFGSGIDEDKELFDLAQQVGLVNKAGAWYSFVEDKDSKKFQGEEKAIEYLKENLEIKTSIQNSIKQLLC